MFCTKSRVMPASRWNSWSLRKLEMIHALAGAIPAISTGLSQANQRRRSKGLVRFPVGIVRVSPQVGAR